MLKKYLTILELVFFLLGISLPLMIVQEFWFFRNEISLIYIIIGLLMNGEYLLSLVVSVFGVIIPLIKITGRLLKIQYLDRLPLYKFSMLDIFLMSFIIFASKFSIIFSAKIDIGFYFLLASTLIGFLQVILYTPIKK